MREGNKNWVKGGSSPNPKGRPRKGMTAADIVSSHISGDDIVKRMVALLDKLHTDGTNVREQCVLMQLIAAYSLGRPVDVVELTVNQKDDNSWSPPSGWSLWSAPQRMEFLHGMRQKALAGQTDDDVILDAEFEDEDGEE